MKRSLSVPAIVALSALLSVPVIVSAQVTTPAPAPPAANPPVASPSPVPGTPVITPRPLTTSDATKSTYTTADQRLRMSKFVGASVYNEQNEKIGTVDDVLLGNSDTVTDVVLSVGGFLGIASKLVEVQYSKIRVNSDKLVIAGATKDQLTHLPEYKYTTARS